MINNCARENDSDYYILYLDDWKLTSHLLQVLLNNGFMMQDNCSVVSVLDVEKVEYMYVF